MVYWGCILTSERPTLQQNEYADAGNVCEMRDQHYKEWVEWLPRDAQTTHDDKEMKRGSYYKMRHVEPSSSYLKNELERLGTRQRGGL